MAKPYRLLIADSDIAYADYLKSCINRSDRLTVIGTAHEGRTALRMIQSEKPDILLVDPLLPEIDGMMLIQLISQSRSSTRSIICLSQFYSPVSVELARKNGASYYLYKPIDPDSLISVLINCTDITEKQSQFDNIREEISETSELSRKIHSILHELGFSSKLIGSRYIAESVALAVESPALLRKFNSGLYQCLALRDNTSPANIERCIRTAISAADTDGRLSRRIHGHPTNKACIHYILRTLEIQI